MYVSERERNVLTEGKVGYGWSMVYLKFQNFHFALYLTSLLLHGLCATTYVRAPSYSEWRRKKTKKHI